MATRWLYQYWDRLRAGRTAPERSAVDPVALRGVLRDTFILGVEPDGELPIRVAGARMSSLFTRELKGSSFFDLFPPADRREVKRVVDAVLWDAAAAVLGLRGAPAGREPMDVELLLLPLRHHGKTHARLLGSLTPSAPRAWLGLLPVEGLAITSMRLVQPGSGASLAADAWLDAPDVANDAGPKPRLRLVHGGAH